jgi:hypothetical protein
MRQALLPATALLALAGLQGQEPPKAPDPPKPTEAKAVPCVPQPPHKPTLKDILRGNAIATAARLAARTVDRPVGTATQGTVQPGASATAATAVADATAPKACQPTK